MSIKKISLSSLQLKTFFSRRSSVLTGNHLGYTAGLSCKNGDYLHQERFKLMRHMNSNCRSLCSINDRNYSDRIQQSILATNSRRDYSSSSFFLKDDIRGNGSNSSNSSSSIRSNSDASISVSGRDAAPKINDEQKTSNAVDVKKAHDSALGEVLLPNLYEDTFGPDSMRVTGYGDSVFEINGVIVESSVVVLASSFFYWNCRTIEDITMEKFLLFTVLYPKPEVLLIGCGTVCNPLFNKDIISQMNDHGIVVEFLSSAIAASTFNVLNAEGRNVALCLVTLVPVEERIDAIV
jgi:NADH dehydrogenase [ubiquinone] 1 alpha subcomplex assembly factor 3